MVCVGDLRLRREGIAESRGIPTRNHAESRRGIQHDKPRNARNRRISRENPTSKCLRLSLLHSTSGEWAESMNMSSQLVIQASRWMLSFHPFFLDNPTLTASIRIRKPHTHTDFLFLSHNTVTVNTLATHRPRINRNRTRYGAWLVPCPGVF